MAGTHRGTESRTTKCRSTRSTLVKRLQPDCLVADLNASNYPSAALYYSDIKGFEQNAGQADQVPTRVQIHQVTRVTSQRVRLALVARHDTPHVAEIGVQDEPRRR